MPPEDTWQCLETFLVSTPGSRAGCRWYVVGKGQGCLHLAAHRTSPTKKNCLTENVSIAEGEKSYPSLTVYLSIALFYSFRKISDIYVGSYLNGQKTVTMKHYCVVDRI